MILKTIAIAAVRREANEAENPTCLHPHRTRNPTHLHRFQQREYTTFVPGHLPFYYAGGTPLSVRTDTAS